MRTSGPKTSGSSIPDVRAARRVALAWLTLLLAASSPLAAQQPAATPAAPSQPQSPAGTSTSALVEGRVVRPTERGEIPVSGAMVTIHRVGPDSAGPIDSMRTDAAGHYAFRFRRWGSTDALYFAASVYRGIAYFSAPLRGAAVRDDDAEIVVFDTTTAPVHFTVQGHHLVVGAPRPTGLRDIVEVYELSNDTVVTAIGRDSLAPVWSAPLPRGATNFVASAGDVAASSIVARDGRVHLIAPFSPGVKQLSFSYALGADAFPLELTLDRPNALLEVLVEEPGAQVRAPSLRSQGNASTQGRTFKRFLAQNAPQGEVIRIEVPSTAAAARSTVVVALAVGLVLAMVGALAVAYRRGGSVRRIAPVRDAAESLVAAIAALDARHDANDPSLSLADYEAQRAALKARLAAALAGTTSSA